MSPSKRQTDASGGRFSGASDTGWSPSDWEPFPAAELAGHALEVAPRLLGAVIRREDATGSVAIRLTEVEAYRGADDPGSHAFRGVTPRTAPMFASAGTLYAYFTYGMHTCLNIVVGEEGSAEACLLRAGEVLEGRELARERRMAARSASARPVSDVELARGPASLVRALGASLADSGERVDEAPFAFLRPRAGADADAPETSPADAALAGETVHRTLRVGVSGPGGQPPYDWRFALDHPTVSRYVASGRNRRGEGTPA